STSLFRQQRPQPSHRLSHSKRVISDMSLRRQKGGSESGISGILGRTCTLRLGSSYFFNLSYSERFFNFCHKKRSKKGACWKKSAAVRAKGAWETSTPGHF